MRYKTYLKNRELFESRYGLQTTMMGYSVLQPMLANIKNQQLFFMLYVYDRQISELHIGVSSIDKSRRYYTIKGRVVSRIGKNPRVISFFDKFGRYEHSLNYSKALLKTWKNKNSKKI